MKPSRWMDVTTHTHLVNIDWGVLISPKIISGEYIFRGVHIDGDTGVHTASF